MLDHFAVRFLYSAESLSYILAAWAWLRVWHVPDRNRVGLAALCSGLGFGIKFLRISMFIVAWAA